MFMIMFRRCVQRRSWPERVVNCLGVWSVLVKISWTRKRRQLERARAVSWERRILLPITSFDVSSSFLLLFSFIFAPPPPSSSSSSSRASSSSSSDISSSSSFFRSPLLLLLLLLLLLHLIIIISSFPSAISLSCSPTSASPSPYAFSSTPPPL